MSNETTERSDADKLRTVAAWLDVIYRPDANPEVQRDLREIASRLDKSAEQPGESQPKAERPVVRLNINQQTLNVQVDGGIDAAYRLARLRNASNEVTLEYEAELLARIIDYAVKTNARVELAGKEADDE